MARSTILWSPVSGGVGSNNECDICEPSEITGPGGPEEMGEPGRAGARMRSIGTVQRELEQRRHVFWSQNDNGQEFRAGDVD